MTPFTFFCCCPLSMCSSTVPQQASLLNHNLYPVNSASMVYFLCYTRCTVHLTCLWCLTLTDWWMFLPICDWAIMVALRSQRGEKGRPSSTSLSPWKRRSRQGNMLVKHSNEAFSMCILRMSCPLKNETEITGFIQQFYWVFFSHLVISS